MPAGYFSVDLSEAGRHEIVAVGQEILSLWITDAPNGVDLRLDMGKNLNLPIAEGTMTTDGSPKSDRINGVWIVNAVAVPGAVVVGGVSYAG